MEEHGRHRKLLEERGRQRYCVMCIAKALDRLDGLVNPVLANSETDLTEIFQTFECRSASAEFKYGQENGAHAKPYGQRNKNQNTCKPRIIRPEQDQSHKRHH